MTGRRTLVYLVALLAAAGGPRLAAAQLTIAPEIGFYIPTEKLIEVASGPVGELEAGPSFGVRLLLSLGRFVSVSVGGNYVPTTFKVQTAGGPVQSQDARLFNGAGQIVLHFIPPTAPLSVFLNGGVGVVSRGGVAFTDEAETSDVTGVFGGGASLRLGGIAFTAGADVFSYTAQYRGTAAVDSELKQLDIQLRLGVGLPLGGGGGMLGLRR